MCTTIVLWVYFFGVEVIMILALLIKKEKGERVVCAICPQIYEIAQKFPKWILIVYLVRYKADEVVALVSL